MELLIVIVVIGILAAITIVAYSGIQERARIATVSSALSQVSKKLALYVVDFSTYPTALSSAGIIDSSSVAYQYSSNTAANPQTFCVTATTGAISYSITQNGTLITNGCPGHGVGGAIAITNLIANPSVEANLNSWNLAIRTGDSFEHSSTRSLNGSKSLGFTTTSIALDTYVETFLVLQPGVYTVSGNVYLPSGGATYGNRDAMFYSSSGLSSFPGTITYNRSKLAQWQRVSGTFTTTTAGTLGVRFYSPLGTTYVDSVMVTGSAQLYQYADGSSSNWVWNGNAHASTSTGSAQ